jgi:hypothetical protein
MAGRRAIDAPSGGYAMKNIRRLLLAAASDASDVATTVKKWVADFNKGGMKAFVEVTADRAYMIYPARFSDREKGKPAVYRGAWTGH